MAEVEGTGTVPVPEELFRQLLPRVTDLSELKAVLHVIEIASRLGVPGVRLEDLSVARVLHSVVGTSSPEPAEARLQRVLDRAVANGSLLRVTAQEAGRSTVYFLPSTRENRELMSRLPTSEPSVAGQLQVPAEADLVVYRPNVFALYEQHIGPLSPLIAEQLRDAERSYPRGWIEEAILAAVSYNKRNWRYIETILSRWEETGGPEGVLRRRT